MPHLRRLPKHFATVERCIYTCELTTCPTCATPLDLCRHYSFDKTVQHLDRVVALASRPKRCPNSACPTARRCYPAAAAGHFALPHSTYGLDVLVQCGWWHDHDALTSRQILARLQGRVQISRRQIDHFIIQARLLRAAAQADLATVAPSVAAYGGVILSIDGLAPEGAQEQLWLVREVLSGALLAAAWLPRVNHETLQTLLTAVQQVLTTHQWPLLATVSDKQHCLELALQTCWPTVPHQWCQTHYLRQVAAPLEALDQGLKVALRKTVRGGVGPAVGAIAKTAAATPGAFSPGDREWPGGPAGRRRRPADREHGAPGLCGAAANQPEQWAGAGGF